MARDHPAALALLSDVQLAARGDRAAQGELARRAGRVVGDLLRRMGANDAMADDIAQEALVRALTSLAAYRGEAAFATWTARIAARVYIKRHRKEARYELMAEPVDPEAAAPADQADHRLDLDRALARLSAPERLCVSLCHGAGMTQEEIAAHLQVPLGTVKSHVTRGLKKLRALLAPPHPKDEARPR
jgi:RNA polymerase sigma-70 factor (ECF subfamily)